MLNWFLKVNYPPVAGTLMVGVSSTVLPTVVTSGANASFGALMGLVAEVTQATSLPLAAVTQPAGSAGAVTPSKFSVKTEFTVGAPRVIVKVTVPRLVAPS